MSQINYGTPEGVVELLNRYEAENPVVGDPGEAPNIWEEIILDLDGYNEFATIAADPKEHGNAFVVNFPGRQVEYRYDGRKVEWRIA